MYKPTSGHRADESCLELYTRTLQPQVYGWQCCVPTPESCLFLAMSAAYLLITYTVMAHLVPFRRKIIPFVTHHNPCLTRSIIYSPFSRPKWPPPTLRLVLDHELVRRTSPLGHGVLRERCI